MKNAENLSFLSWNGTPSLAVVPAATPDGWDEMSAVTGRVFVAQNPEQFTYDADGNMLTDGRFRYTWNGENRLVRAQELCAPTNRNPYTIAYAYDHKGRMVSKRITENDGSDTLVKSIAYVWDGWNIIRETQWPVTSDQWSAGPLATNHYPLVTDYVWGLDLNGTLQGAGGVGGLLAVVRDDGVFLPTYDANGNVSEYVSTDGSIVAHYDYSPFGETLIESGDLAAIFTHRFSTKPWCPVTGLCEYQMRKYRPEIGRWLSRDDNGELPVNLYVMINNAVPLFVDLLGNKKLTLRFDMAKDANWFDKILNPNTVYTTDMTKVLSIIKKAVGTYNSEGKGTCNCIDYLTLAGHGSAGKMELGLHTYSSYYIDMFNNLSGTAEEKKKRWGVGENYLPLKQIESFAAIANFLCEGATIEFGTCNTGKGAEGAALKEMLEQLFGHSVTIILYDKLTSYCYDHVHIRKGVEE